MQPQTKIVFRLQDVIGSENMQVIKQKGIYYEDKYFISPIYDSGHEGMHWDRLFLDMQSQDFQITIWIDDSYEKLGDDCLEQSIPTCSSTHNACLLYSYKGRYLRFKIQFYKASNPSTFLGYTLYFPYRTHLELLPQMYQKDEDLHLYFAPMEDIFISLQEEIRSMHHMWNPRRASEVQLLEMLDFLGLSDFSFLDYATIRTLLIRKEEWMKYRGSLSSIKTLSEILLHRNVVIEINEKQTKICIVAWFTTEEEAIQYERLIQSLIPLGINVSHVWLNRACLQDCYLDIGVCLQKKVLSTLGHTSEGESLWL